MSLKMLLYLNYSQGMIANSRLFFNLERVTHFNILKNFKFLMILIYKIIYKNGRKDKCT